MNKIYYNIEGHKGCFYNADISEITAEEAARDWYDEVGCDEDSRIIVSLSEHKDGPYTDFEVSIWHTVSFDARKL